MYVEMGTVFYDWLIFYVSGAYFSKRNDNVENEMINILCIAIMQ